MKKIFILKYLLLLLLTCIGLQNVNAQAPANDECLAATTLIVGSSCVAATYSSVNATASVSAPTPSCGAYQGGDVWFKAVVPASGKIRVEVRNVSGINPVFVIYTGACNALTQYSCNEFNPDKTYSDPALASQTIYIRVFNFNNAAGGSFNICVWEPPVPANDNCVDATSVSVGASCVKSAFTNAYATSQPTSVAPDPACGGYNGGDVWFKFVAPASGKIRLEFSDFVGVYAQYALYTGTCGSFTQLYCGSFNPEYTINNPALGGQTIYLRVWNNNSEEGGTFQFCVWEPPVPANDNCADATSVFVGASCLKNTFTNAYATSQSTSVAPDPICGGYSGGDVWFKFVVPASGKIRLEFTGSAQINPQYALYSGSCGSFTQLYCGSFNPEYTIHSPSRAGQTIYLRVWNVNSDEGGTFQLCIWEPPIPANDNCANATPLIAGTTCSPTNTTNKYATTQSTTVAPDPTCGNYLGGDVWYTLVMPASGRLTVRKTDMPGSNAQLVLYSGTCGSFTQIDCSQNLGKILVDNISLAGQTLYLRVFNYFTDEGGDYSLCAYETTPDVNLSVSSNTGTEAGQTVITVTATASAPVNGNQTVSLAVSGTNITSGDYTLSNTTITILNGQTTGTVTFTVVDDALVEGTETATLTISNPSSGILLGSTITQNIVITDNDVAAPTVITTTVTSVTTTSAISGGEVTSDGGSAVTVRGVAYSTSPNAITPVTTDGTGTGTFTSSLNGLSANTIYYYRAYATNNVGTSYGTEMSFTTSAPPPVNDECSAATTITVGSSCVPATYSSVGATASSGAPTPTCGFYQGGDVWFKAVVPASGKIRVEITGVSGINAQFAIYTGSCNALTQYSCNQLDPTITINDLSLASQTIYIRVYGFNTAAGGSFNICAWEPPVPANDNCTDAILVTAGTTCAYNNSTNAYATAQSTSVAANPSCGFYQGGDVWFKFVAPASGKIRLEFENGTANAQYVLYSGTCGSFSEIFCGQLNPEHTISDPVLGSQTLYLRVFNYGNKEGGTFKFCVYEPVVPANDNCANAILVSAGTSCVKNTFTNAYATAQPASVAPDPSCGFYQGGDVWFKFVAPASGKIRLEFEGSPECNPQYALYSGTCGSFTQIFCGQLDPEHTIHNPSLGGQTLYLRVFNYGSEEGGTFRFCVWEPPIPANDDCANATPLAVNTTCTPTNTTNRYTTSQSTSVAPNPSCGFYQGGDVWYTVVMPASGKLTIQKTDMVESNAQFALYSGTCGTFSEIACAELMNTLNVNNQSLAGQTLYLRVYSYNYDEGGEYSLCAYETIPNVNLSVSANTGSEAGQTVITVTATANEPLTSNQTVTLGVTGTNITAGDYSLSNTAITILAGQTTGSVTFTVVDDAVVESTETAILTISNPSHGISLGSITTQNVSITDNDVAPAATTTTLASSQSPSTVGQSVTFTATVSGTASPAGNVSFYDGATLLGTTALSGSTATYTTSLLAQGSHSITATYNGNANNASSTSNIVTQVVNAVPTVSVASGSNAAEPSTNGSLTITFSPATTAPTDVNYAYTGSATFNTDYSISYSAGTPSTTTSTGTLTIPAGISSVTVTVTPIDDVTIEGAENITLTISSPTQGYITGNAAANINITDNDIAPAATTTSLSSSQNPSTVGQSVTFTATVSGTASPTGNVSFYDGATLLGTTALSGNTATYTTSLLAQGSHSITATYNGNANNATSTSNIVAQVVNAAPPATTTTSLSSSQNPSTVGQSVTFTATVSGTASPTGNVSFYDGATLLGTTALSGSTATYATSALTQGSHSITATYNGNTNNASSTSAVVTQIVNPAPTTTTLTSSQNPSTVGQSVTFTATVSGTASPTGNVSFYDGATLLGTTALSGNTATYTTSLLAQGSHSITATYNGNANNATSTSNIVAQVVNAAPPATTTTSLSSSQNPSTVGQSVTFTATVSGTASPTGNVSFYDGATLLGTTALSGSTATYTTSSLVQGSHSITAIYNGNTNNASSTSNVVTQVVNAAPIVSVASGSNAAEPSTNGSFTITFSSATTTSTDVNYAYTGSATFNTDYSASYSSGTPSSSTSTGTLTVPAGTSSVTVTVIPIDDVTVEGTEIITLTLSAPTQGYVISNAAASINLNDNDIAPPAVITYYPRTSATDLSQPGNWTDDATGTAGTSPSNFTTSNQIFNITRKPFVTGAWIISGGSNVILSVTGLTFTSTSSLTVGTGSDFNFGGNNNYSTTFKSTQTNTASLLQVSGTISNANNVTVERFISSSGNRAYRLLAPSVNSTSTIHANWQENATTRGNNPNAGYGTHITGTTVDQTNGFDATQTGQGSLFNFNNITQQWIPAANTNVTMLTGKTGYLLYVRGDRSMNLDAPINALPSSNAILRATGTLLQGTQTYSSLASNDFSLVTNPYASAINWSSIYTNNSGSFANYYTYWDPNIASRGGYVTVRNDGTQNPNMTPVPPVFPGVNIQSGQAFFVLSTTASPTFTIREIDKSTTNNIDVFRTTTPATQKFTTSLFYNDAEHGRRLADGVTSLYDDSYTKAIDGNDAEEINNWDENIAIARAGKRLSIEERPTITAKDTLALFMNNMKQQSYEFEFIPSGLNPNTIAILTDNYTGGKTYLDVTAKTVVPFSVTSATASSASDRFYIIFSPGGALPVTITSVKAYQKNTGVQTEWTTQQENNIDRYEVERSQNGQQFTKLGAVNATGNTSNVSNYNLFDANPFSGVNYYRIKIIDKQGQATYSQVVKVNISSKANQITVTPNPVHGNTVMVQMTNMQKGSYTISLTNKLGQLLISKVIDHAGGTTTESITPSKAFAAGVYQLKVTGNGISVTQQVLKD